MANKKYTDIATGTAYTDSVILVANPVTGALKRVTVAQLLAASGTEPGGGGGGGDVTAPTVVSATVENANPNQVVVVFSESVTVTTAGWSFRRNTSNWAISSVSGSGTTWTFTMATSAANGETIDRSYNSATGATVDGSANELASFTNSSVTNNVGGSYQSESDTFFAANTGLTSGQKTAVDNLVIALKSIGWSKFKAVYPFVGGTASAHKWNLVNPVDTNAGFRLSFVGSMTHDSNGVTPGSTTSDYADTFWVPSANATTDSNAMGYYARTLTDNKQLMGGYSVGSSIWQLGTYGGNLYYACGDSGDNVTTPSPGTRLLVVSRTSSTALESYRDGTSLETTSQTYSGASTASVYLFGRNTGSSNDSAGGIACSFAFISTGLSDAEVTSLTTAVNTYQTALSRNV